MAQAGWPEGGWPKIPWYSFLVPLQHQFERRELTEGPRLLLCDGKLCACHAWAGPLADISINTASVIMLACLIVLYCSLILSLLMRRVRFRSLCFQRDANIAKGHITRWLFIAMVTLAVNITVTVVGTYCFSSGILCSYQSNHARLTTYIPNYPFLYIWGVVWAISFCLGNCAVLAELWLLSRTYIALRQRAAVNRFDPIPHQSHSRQSRISGEEEVPRPATSMDSQAQQSSTDRSHTSTKIDQRFELVTMRDRATLTLGQSEPTVRSFPSTQVTESHEEPEDIKLDKSTSRNQ